MRKRVVSALLALIMVAAMLPVLPASAAAIRITPDQIKAKIDHYVQTLEIGAGYYYYWNAGLRAGGDDARLQQALDRYASGSGSKADLEVGLSTAGSCKGRYSPPPNDTHRYEVTVGGTNGCTSNCFNGGAQCCGFARYFLYYLFGQKPCISGTDKTDTEYYYEYKNKTAALSSIGGFQAGDHVRVNGHSFIYYGVGDQNRILAVQINGHSSSRPCSLNFENVYSSAVNSYGGGGLYTLSALEQDYAAGRVTIQRYKYIYTCSHVHENTGKSAYVYHNKDMVKCSLCQDVYPTPSLSDDPVYAYMDINLNGSDKTSAPGHIDAPYAEAPVGNRYKNWQTVCVRGSFVNARGNTWYQITSGEWLSGEYLTEHVHTFNTKGFCPYCDTYISGDKLGRYYAIWTGPMTLKVDHAKIHFAPYGKSLRFMTYTGEITVDAKVVNGHGHEWYRIYGGDWNGGWIYKDYVKTTHRKVKLAVETDMWYCPSWDYHTVGHIPAKAEFTYYPDEVSAYDPNWRSVRYKDTVGFVPGYILDNNLTGSRVVEPDYTPEETGESLNDTEMVGGGSSSGGSSGGGTSSGSSWVFVQSPTDPAYLAKRVIGETTATLVANIQKPAGSSVTACGLRIFSSDGTLLKDHREAVTNVGASLTSFHAWYDIQSELGLTLTPGTDYMYQFYAVVDGVTHEGGRTGFTTNGPTPVTPPPAPEEPKQEVVLYELTLDPNGAPVEKQVRKIPYTTTIGVLPVPIWEGYTFNGWYTRKEGGSRVNDYATYNATVNLTLYAHWTPKIYTLIFDANGGTCAEKSRAMVFDTIIGDMPVPTRAGYVFDGWYGKAEGGSLIHGQMRYNAPFDVTVYAHWKPVMSDVATDAWYADAVNYVVKSGLMSGYSADRFGPNDTLNRAMVVQVLYNKEGKPALNGTKHSFKDVSNGQWFNNAVTWGSKRGVVSGFGGGLFKPEDAVTLEQTAVILWNYAGKPNATGTLINVGSYSDWAANALRWCTAKGILNNVPFTNATQQATRAQIAQILMNFTIEKN